MYFEDVQWCYLIKTLGYKVLYTPFTQAIHYVSASSPNPDWRGRTAKNQQSLINERIFLLREKGWFYIKILYLLRTLKFISLRKENFRKIAKIYWQEFCKLSYHQTT